MGGKSLLLCAFILLSVTNNVLGRMITFKLKVKDLTDYDAASGAANRLPGSDPFAIVYVNDKLHKQIARAEKYTWQTNNVDWRDVFTLNVQKGDKIRIDVKDYNGDGYEDTWHGSVTVHTEDIENVGPHRYRIVDLYNSGLQSGTLIMDVLGIRWQENSPCS